MTRLPSGKSGHFPSGSEFIRILVDRGQVIEVCTPFVDSQEWLKVMGSGVLIDITEEDEVNCMTVALPWDVASSL